MVVVKDPAHLASVLRQHNCFHLYEEFKQSLREGDEVFMWLDSEQTEPLFLVPASNLPFKKPRSYHRRQPKKHNKGTHKGYSRDPYRR